MIFNETPTKNNVTWENVLFWISFSTSLSGIDAQRLVETVRSRTEISPFDLYISVRLFHNKEESEINRLTDLIIQIWSLSSWNAIRAMGKNSKKPSAKKHDQNPILLKNEVTSHRLGEDCDICDGSGRDNEGRTCRKLVE